MTEQILIAELSQRISNLISILGLYDDLLIQKARTKFVQDYNDELQAINDPHALRILSIVMQELELITVLTIRIQNIQQAVGELNAADIERIYQNFVSEFSRELLFINDYDGEKTFAKALTDIAE